MMVLGDVFFVVFFIVVGLIIFGSEIEFMYVGLNFIRIGIFDVVE